jgi:hypothetical protein
MQEDSFLTHSCLQVSYFTFRFLRRFLSFFLFFLTFSFFLLTSFRLRSHGQVTDCLFEYQKLISPDDYKSAQKTAHAAPKLSLQLTADAGQTTETDDKNKQNMYLNSHRTMNDDENLKKALKYNPELAAACQAWIEGRFILFIFLSFYFFV